jgi:bifunctional non-homologous end joining protein LigD
MTVWQTIWGAGFGCSRGWAFARKPSRLCALPTFPKHFNGHDLRKLLVFERKALLKKIIAETDIQYSKRFEVDGGETFEHACSIGLEGVVSEVRDSKYKQVHIRADKRLGRESLRATRDVDDRGFALDGSKWDGLHLARRRGSDQVYAGKVDHGFDKDSAKELQSRLKPPIRTTKPYSKRIAHRGIWVEPSLLAEIEYRAKSAEGRFGIRYSRVCGRICDGRGRAQSSFSQRGWMLGTSGR